MEQDELHEHWKQHNERAAWVRENRDSIHEHTNTSEEIPPGSLYEVRQWLKSYKSVVSKQLKPDEDSEE